MDLCVGVGARELEIVGRGHPLRHRAAKFLSSLLEVIVLWRTGARSVVGRFGVARQCLGRDLGLEVEGGPQVQELLVGQFLDLMGCVSPLDVRSKGPALDRLSENHGRLPVIQIGGHFVGGVDLAEVKPSATQSPDLVIGHVGDEFFCPRVLAKEVVANVGAVLGLVPLIFPIDGLVHDLDQGAVMVGGEKPIPTGAPDQLYDIPPSTKKDRLELVDYLAVPSDWPIKTLQVAVNDPGEVVQSLPCGE